MGKIPSNSSSVNGTNNLPPSYTESVKSGCSITNLPKDQMAALVSNMTNAIHAPKNLNQEESIIQKNLQDIKKRFSFMPNGIRFMLENNEELQVSVLTPEGNSKLPILEKKITDFVDLSSPLPSTLQKERVSTILDLLAKEFPKLTSSPFFNKETKIPRFVFSAPIPINNEGKGNFFPQIQAEGEVAYIAWDSSGSRVARGFTKKTCDVLFENRETFSGVALSKENLEGIEKGAGESAHFMNSKITIIGILIVKSSKYDWSQNRVERDSINALLCCDGPSHTSFGMLGCQGASVSSVQEDVSDREKRAGEKLLSFCLEIVPQFSSKNSPVEKDDLVMAIDIQFQKMAFAEINK